MDPHRNGGQGRYRTTDTRIFSCIPDRPRLYISINYRAARCLIYTTLHKRAQLTHAKLTHRRAIAA